MRTMIKGIPSLPQCLVAWCLAGLLAAGGGAARAQAAPITQIGTYPANNATRVAPEAELWFAFDQPTSKAGAFSVADLDSGSGGVLLALDPPRWSALGDTVFLKPSVPMTFGHLHGMKVNAITAPDPQNSSADLPLIYFTVSPRANVQRVGSSTFESVSLVPDHPSPVTIGVRETAGTAAYFTSAYYRFYPADEIDLNDLSIVGSPATYVAFSGTVPRRGTAALTVPVTLSRREAALAADGVLGLDIVFEGYEIGRAHV